MSFTPYWIFPKENLSTRKTSFHFVYSEDFSLRVTIFCRNYAKILQIRIKKPTFYLDKRKRRRNCHKCGKTCPIRPGLYVRERIGGFFMKCPLRGDFYPFVKLGGRINEDNKPLHSCFFFVFWRTSTPLFRQIREKLSTSSVFEKFDFSKISLPYLVVQP